MFYLGSIAGFLPYILALSLTLVWGGHAGLPFFTSPTTSESRNEIVKEIDYTQDVQINLNIFQAIVKEITNSIPVLFFVSTRVLNNYLTGSSGSSASGISLLRAPPLSSF